MRRALKLVLVIGVLLGLFGQTVAVAASPAVVTAIERMAPTTMSVECLGMMKGNDKSSVPCDRMTLACVAGMGCLTIYAVEIPSPPVAEAMVAALPPTTPPFRALQGRSVQPEPHPPSTLA